MRSHFKTKCVCRVCLRVVRACRGGGNASVCAHTAHVHMRYAVLRGCLLVCWCWQMQVSSCGLALVSCLCSRCNRLSFLPIRARRHIRTCTHAHLPPSQLHANNDPLSLTQTHTHTNEQLPPNLMHDASIPFVDGMSPEQAIGNLVPCMREREYVH